MCFFFCGVWGVLFYGREGGVLLLLIYEVVSILVNVIHACLFRN